MRYSSEQKNELRKIPISGYLQSLGIEPVSMSGGRLVYHCPIMTEKTPSFMVHPETNKFKCFGCDQKGDVIELAMQIEKLDFLSILDRLTGININNTPTFSFIGQTDSNNSTKILQHDGIKLLDVNPLRTQEWQEYVTGRGIPLAIARQYLNEVVYQNDIYRYTAVGFSTDNGGYAIRSPRGKGFKAFIGQSCISTLEVGTTSTINLFEGFFDYLSAMTYYKRVKPSNTTIVLNSTSNIGQALPMLENAERINCYLDNDTTGNATVLKLKKLGLPVHDFSLIYADYKDFNDFIKNRAFR